MTVFEKIKRCVSLVWDFEEIYDEEDIEDFCRNELCTYPQHDEIMEYFKYLEKLEKENKELRSLLQGVETQITETTKIHLNTVHQLIQAKKLLTNLIRVTWGEGWNYSLDWKIQAENFLKEIE